ncbi:integral membrane protein [Seminavis robusta]|uniref:Integral membrane protein n=1 Tax=Seminavis robusta TaxID=568900 RepID=A0A9N8D773_9STRA|nr:integral membrane protein [Seminavis robusta]|eukprot:Sro25_g017200.1 integral membrane protein (403) ;mRNA; f:131908-133235
MANSTACKACVIFVVILLAAGGGILAWQLLSKDDNDGSMETGDKGGLFGTGLFAANNNNASSTTDSSSTVTSTLAPTMSMAPSAAPSAMPFEYEYRFNRCTPDAAQCCNGLENLCNWPVNDILFGIPHNAMATNDVFLVPNQLRPVEEALEAGFRGINVDFCVCQGLVKLCHGFCGLGEVDPKEFLERVVTFMDQPENQNDVFLLTMELNSDAGQTVDLNVIYDTVLTQVEGFTDNLYVHEGPGEPWPTLGTLIANNKRLIAFHFNGPDCSEAASCPDGMHYYFQYAQETPFDMPSIDSILDKETSCIITRGATTTDGSFFGVNNFVEASAFDLDNQLEAATQANSLEFAKEHIEACSRIKQDGVYYGDPNVNLLYVDFWHVGNIVQLVQEHNQRLGEYTGN